MTLIYEQKKLNFKIIHIQMDLTRQQPNVQQKQRTNYEVRVTERVFSVITESVLVWIPCAMAVQNVLIPLMKWSSIVQQHIVQRMHFDVGMEPVSVERRSVTPALIAGKESWFLVVTIKSFIVAISISLQ